MLAKVDFPFFTLIVLVGFLPKDAKIEAAKAEA